MSFKQLLKSCLRLLIDFNNWERTQQQQKSHLIWINGGFLLFSSRRAIEFHWKTFIPNTLKSCWIEFLLFFFWTTPNSFRHIWHINAIKFNSELLLSLLRRTLSVRLVTFFWARIFPCLSLFWIIFLSIHAYHFLAHSHFFFMNRFHL